ncbi:MAG: hypothetical protein U0S12_14535 [Fimbriimonadales bacterium]
MWRVAAWLIPIACMTGGSLAIYTQYQRLETAKSAMAQAQVELDQAQSAYLAAQRAEIETRYAAQAETIDEEAAFLRDLRKRAVENGVTIVKWTAVTTPASPPPVTDQKEEKKADPLKDIKRVSSDLVMEGPYGSMRKFVQGLLESDRLYTTSNLRWTRSDDGGTVMSVTIARYTTSRPINRMAALELGQGDSL